MTPTAEILRELARPFPDKYVHKNPSGGGTYIKHHVIVQRLIQVFGRPPNFEKVEVIFGDVDAIAPNPEGKSDRAKEGRPALKNVVVGVVARLSIDVNGERWISEDEGDCEEPHNWKTDGQRLKDAMSDAYKRCAMRWGCGLHLWSQNEYFLHEQLSQSEPESPPGSKLPSPAPAETPVVGSPETASSGVPEGEPDAAGGQPPVASPPDVAKSESGSGPDSASSGSSEGGDVASFGEVAAADPSSGELIRLAVRDKRVFIGQLVTVAKNLAKERGIKVSMSSKTIFEQGDDFLDALVDRLELRQGSMA